MSDLNDFLLRIQTDYRFYLQFRKNPDQVLATFSLSSEETEALKDPSSSLWSSMRGVPTKDDSLYADHLSSDQFDVRLKTYQMANHIIAGDPGRNEFDVVETRKRPEIKAVVAAILGAITDSERKVGVSALIDNIR